ncbi:hypothetical protein ACLB2K_050666 [Fragaria x ananassa]
MKKKDVSEAMQGRLSSRVPKDPLMHTLGWTKWKRAFESSELPEEKKYFNHAHRSRIQSDFLNIKKRDDEGVIEFEQRFTTLSYHVSYLVPDERTRIDMFIGALRGVYADKMIGIIYLTFLDVVGAAMAIKTRGTYSARP